MKLHKRSSLGAIWSWLNFKNLGALAWSRTILRETLTLAVARSVVIPCAAVSTSRRSGNPLTSCCLIKKRDNRCRYLWLPTSPSRKSKPNRISWSLSRIQQRLGTKYLIRTLKFVRRLTLQISSGKIIIKVQTTCANGTALWSYWLSSWFLRCFPFSSGSIPEQEKCNKCTRIPWTAPISTNNSLLVMELLTW